MNLTEDKQCKSLFTMINGEIHRCELFDGHPDRHRVTYDWEEEEAGV